MTGDFPPRVNSGRKGESATEFQGVHGIEAIAAARLTRSTALNVTQRRADVKPLRSVARAVGMPRAMRIHQGEVRTLARGIRASFGIGTSCFATSPPLHGLLDAVLDHHPVAGLTKQVPAAR